MSRPNFIGDRPAMTDPLAQVISLLKPRAVFSKGISGAGRWAVRYSDFGNPSFCVVLEGGCKLAVEDHAPLSLQAGDFVLLPATPGFVMSSFEAATPRLLDARAAARSNAAEIRHGRKGGPPDVRLLGGWFEFESPDASLLVSLLPRMVHVRGLERLSTLVKFVNEETAGALPGRELVLTRIIEVLLVEALRATSSGDAPPGMLRGLADARIALALRSIHADPSRAWTMAQLAAKAALSRSTFFERFTRAVGLPPMEYLLAWRMAIAKDLLRREDIALAEVAERVGYGSASTFSTAFSRHVGQAPSQFARMAC